MNGFEGLDTATLKMVGYRMSAAQRSAFNWYAQELIEWNKRFNLTAITDPVEIEIKHFLDSISCLKVESFRPPGRVIDIGSGAGFPGIPIKLLYPQFDITLVESVGKKVRFCEHVRDHLELQGLRALHARAEVLGREPEHRESYDWGLARAVAVGPVILEYLLPFIRVGGSAILQKGETGPAEMHRAQEALRVLGGEVEQIHRIELPCVTEARHLIMVRKTAATPPKYPRRPGIAAKRPINTS